MPSKSKKQQRFFGVIEAYKKGKIKNPSPDVVRAANSMSEEDVKHFASTKHEGLPEKVSEFIHDLKTSNRVRVATEAYLLSKKAWAKTAIRIQNKDVVYDFESIEEAAAYLTLIGTLSAEEVSKMLSDREPMINGFSIIYGAAKEAEMIILDPHRKMNSMLRANEVAERVHSSKTEDEDEEEKKEKERKEEENNKRIINETAGVTSDILEAVSKLLK